MVVVAAGNSNTDAQYSTPANCAQAVTVASTGPSGKRAYYSNYGTLVDIAAPGGSADLSGAFPLAAARVRSTGYSGRYAFGSGSYTYTNMQGTSMAAPHAAGLAALLYGVRSNASVSEILALMQSNVTVFPADNGLTPCNTSRCGNGIANARAAVAAAKGIIPTPNRAQIKETAVSAKATNLAAKQRTAQAKVFVKQTSVAQQKTTRALVVAERATSVALQRTARSQIKETAVSARVTKIAQRAATATARIIYRQETATAKASQP
jgi:serine protease